LGCWFLSDGQRKSVPGGGVDTVQTVPKKNGNNLRGERGQEHLIMRGNHHEVRGGPITCFIVREAQILKQENRSP